MYTLYIKEKTSSRNDILEREHILYEWFENFDFSLRKVSRHHFFISPNARSVPLKRRRTHVCCEIVSAHWPATNLCKSRTPLPP